MTHNSGINELYRGSIISQVKAFREANDPRKRDLSPSVLDFGPVRFLLARHFGFCFGVENAVRIAYETLESNPDQRIFFLSEMIHNPKVNCDLRARGVRFAFTPSGEQLVPWEDLTPDDIVVVPAFGTTLEMQEQLAARGIDAYTYNTTCPFVEKVWKRSGRLGEQNYTVVVHGKAAHEETRATFSHSVRSAPTVIVLDLNEARILADIIRGTLDRDAFDQHFRHKCSDGFDPARHLERIGVVNQTTMLATETREIADVLQTAMIDRYGKENLQHHFADTSDTLCYATNENQNATRTLIERGGDLALVVGGYNSSNTSHIVELCQEAIATYFIQNADEIVSVTRIRHFSLDTRAVETTDDWLPTKRPLDVVLTCGASCPDAVLDEVLSRVLSFFNNTHPLDRVLRTFTTPKSNG
ncbi:MAG: 4-hydroxy-3-methylbut-2-enyl diphosphate reductase [Candidatus Latescibacterota bacterium]|nr:MAG: 4-hydroxy-3-methylbut-2-enyl diphosphate reductase [Candidatus Latescibacterota bacterium]